MTGYAYVALGSADTISDPTCGATKAAITNAAPCASGTNWSDPAKLCMSGSIPALPATPAATDYASNWGVSLGINAGDPEGGTLGQSFTSITIAISGTPSSGLRAQVHRKGDAVDTTYCAPLTSAAMPLVSFTTTCYDTAKPGTALTAADVTNIDKVAVQVSSGAAAISVSSLCITGITFAK
jgi:hypothetical protein